MVMFIFMMCGSNLPVLLTNSQLDNNYNRNNYCFHNYAKNSKQIECLSIVAALQGLHTWHMTLCNVYLIVAEHGLWVLLHCLIAPTKIAVRSSLLVTAAKSKSKEK